MAKHRAQGAAGEGDGRLFRVADRLHSASIHLLRRVRGADRRTGLSPQRLSVLSVLVFGGPRSVGALASAEQVSAPTISRLVTGLEKLGLVRRRRSPEDQRVCFLEATTEGRAILEAGRRRRIEALAADLSGFTARDLDTLEKAALLMNEMGARQRSGGGRASRG